MDYFLLLLPIVGLLMMAFALKDIFTSPMNRNSKILWAIVVVVFNIVGVCVYYFSKVLGVKRDPRTTYRERYEKRFKERLDKAAV